MKETEQTLLDQIKDQVAKENFNKHRWDLLYPYEERELWPVVCERYYQAKAKEVTEDVKSDAISYVRSTPNGINFSPEPFEGMIDTNKFRLYEAFIAGATGRFTRSQVQASCEATLKNASDNAVVRGYCAGCERAGLLHCAHADSCGNNVVIVDKSSINHPSNIVIV